jgi:hypothetical protein
MALRVPLKADREPTEIFEYACHEGNYSMRNILGGAVRMRRPHPARAGEHLRSETVEEGTRSTAES